MIWRAASQSRRRGEVCVETRHAQPNEPDECARVESLDRPTPKPVFIESSLNPIDKGIACDTIQWRGEVPHDVGIGVHLRERLAILRTPSKVHRTEEPTANDELVAVPPVVTTRALATGSLWCRPNTRCVRTQSR
jgi:hypothetical protein